MASENRPGVIITQALSETPAVTASPSLVPLVMAPCFQIIEAVNSDGSVNLVAKHATKYNQSSMNITQAEFPDPRDNIDELEIYEDKVNVQLMKFAGLEKLQRGSNETTGSAFLARIKHIYSAAIRFNLPSFVGFSSEQRLVMAIDATNSADTTKNLTYVFDTDVTDVDGVVDVINEEYGKTIAFKDGNTVIVRSLSYGPASSVTVRGGSTALGTLTDQMTNTTFDNRVEGSGLSASDDEDGDLTSPYVSYSRGEAYLSTGVNSGTLNALSAWEDWAGYVDNESTPAFNASKAPAVTFTGSAATIPLKAATKSSPGDYMVADALRSQQSEVTFVEETRFKLGKINTSSSTYSKTTGEILTRIYDTVEFNLVEAATPFSPQNAYFVAQNLVFGSITPAGTAASVTSTPHDNYLAARKAQVSAHAINNGNFGAAESMTGLTLVIQETVDGVQKDEVTITFAGSLTLSQVATKITENASLDCTSAVEGEYLVISSGTTGADQIVIVKSNGTANSILGFSTTDATTGTGKYIEIAEQAVITTASQAANVSTLTSTYQVHLEITDSFGTHEVDATTTAVATPATIEDIVDAIAVAHGGSSSDRTIYHDGIAVATVTAGSTTANVFTEDLTLTTNWEIQFSTIEGGASVNISVLTATSDIGLATNMDGDGDDLLNGTVLKFSLDENPTEFEARFESNAVDTAIEVINEAVGGDVDIAKMNASTGAITLTSSVVGTPSQVLVDGSGAQVATVINISSTAVNGAGRPNPDYYIDPNTNAVILGANQLRNTTTGVPYSVESAFADVYIEYTALRKDVTASASEPGIISFGSITELEASIGPISKDNPLGLAAYLAMLNSPTTTISCLGIDETTLAAPLGTVDGYLRALELLESKEVYSLAPMTDDLYIQQLISTHVQTLSSPSERGERIALLWADTPDRERDTSIENGSGDATQNGEDNQLTLESNHSSAVISAGITDLDDIAVDKGLYLQVTTISQGSTSVYNYSVSSLDGLTASLRNSFSGDENTDGFYATKTLSGTASFASIEYVLRIRGKKLLITGTTLPDVKKITETAAAQASSFDHRRVFLLFGDSVDVSIDGVTTNIPGYYIAAGLAGMIGSQLAQQPFTNVVMTGYSKVYGTDDTYSENQMDTIADGGRYVLKNLAGGIAARHQRSTSNSSIEARELSITKAIDFLAKGLRQINRVFIGKYVITPGFLDQLTMANEGYLRRVVQIGVVRTSKLTSLLQSETAPDTVLIEVEVQPAYPCNKIRITIVS